jgi:hypothetical protein
MSSNNHGFIHYQRADGILVYEYHDVSQPSIDEWMKVSEENNAYAIENHLHLRVLVFIGNATPTSYAIKRGTDVFKEATQTELVMSIAMVLRSHTMTNVLLPIVKRLQSFMDEGMQICANEEQALQWLAHRERVVLQNLQMPTVDHLLPLYSLQPV